MIEVTKRETKKYRIKLTTLTSVHVGSGETIDFTRVVIDQKECFLYSFNLLELIYKLNDRERSEFERIVDSPGIITLVNLQKFYLYRVFEKIKKIAKSVYSVPKDLVEDYKRVLDLKTEREIRTNFNRLNIHLCQRESYTGMPYIPGSSLKGALKTGYLEGLFLMGINTNDKNLEALKDKILAMNDIRSYRREKDRLFKELEDLLLSRRRIQDDPFRSLKISDLMAEENVRVEVLYGINVKRENLKREGPRVLYEAIAPGAVFTGTLEIDTNEKGLDWKKLFEYNRNHYKDILNEETKLIKSFKISVANQLNPYVEKIKNNRALFLKLGRHSGAHAVTIKGLRRILIRGQRNRFYIGDATTTVWLASRTKRLEEMAVPFGWVLLEVSEL